MQIQLDNSMRSRLQRLQRTEKDKRRYINIFVLPMPNLGFNAAETTVALGIDDVTIYRYG